MSLSEFSVSRVHCFRTEARLRIAPLTLLFGPNNAGKSTLLRALALCAASVGTSLQAALDLGAEPARGAAFRDLRSQLDSVNQVAFTFKFAAADGASHSLSYIFMEEADGGHVLRDLRIREPDGSGEELRISLEGREIFERMQDDAIAWTGAVPFSGIRPSPTAEQPTALQALLQRSAARLDELRASLYWLTAVRAAVPRKRTLPEREPPRAADGTWLQVRLGRDAAQSSRGLRAAVSAQLEALFDCELHADLDERDLLLRGSPGRAPWRLPLADLGEGITQVLPVITLCCLAERGDLGAEPVLCIEQPEMHLHGDAERDLARFLCRVAQSPSQPRLVLETHSELLLSAVLLEIAEGRLKPEQLALHWLSRESPLAESQIQHVAVDARGIPSGWPAGAFGERAELARALFQARRR